MRGERYSVTILPFLVCGSSPHARGTPDIVPDLLMGIRFIPACAGNAPEEQANQGRGSVHPRMRGERVDIAVALDNHGGSSPHARGTLERPIVHCVAFRFIPACAGNAAPPGTPARAGSVHPRMRGERNEGRDCPFIVHGSSPHARGTHPEQAGQWQSTRFIPACAGNAAGRYKGGRAQTVHPRMRGERRLGRDITRSGVGSSPHARGTRMARRPGSARCRFIPACAGNARSASRPEPSSTVHPRMRGERTDEAAKTYAQDGSSPHARGTQDVVGGVLHGVRFIPACAGNAAARTCPGGQGPVHPRMRGERSSSLFCSIPSRGSSPHARGTPMKGPSQCVIWRFIPACAGNAATQRHAPTL